MSSLLFNHLTAQPFSPDIVAEYIMILAEFRLPGTWAFLSAESVPLTTICTPKVPMTGYEQSPGSKMSAL